MLQSQVYDTYELKILKISSVLENFQDAFLVQKNKIFKIQFNREKADLRDLLFRKF